MRIACVHWYTKSVGGIATHLNTLRLGAIKAGDQFDILHCNNWKRKSPTIFGERRWVKGGETKIWIDGEIPQTSEASKWLKDRYDVILFSFPCPHQTKAYKTPDFKPIYDTNLPKVSWVMDGYWDTYDHWARPLLPLLKGVLCPQESYALPLRKIGYENLKISPFPFIPAKGRSLPKDANPPLLIWPNQWKNIKGVNGFIEAIPKLPRNLRIEMYSDGIRYYQLRSEQRWRDAVSVDHFQGFNGQGRADFFGNVDIPEIVKVFQRASYTVNLQGMTAKKETYKAGSYNNTEVEALWYGVYPILHSSTENTRLPLDLFIGIDSADELPGVLEDDLRKRGYRSEERKEASRAFVRKYHMYTARYRDVSGMFE